MPEYRRRLPHFHPSESYLFLTWRLWGSLPVKADLSVHSTPGHAFAALDHCFDRSASGPLWLKDPRIADLVSRSIVIGESERRFYHLCAWVVMPNHVHLLVRPQVAVPILMRWLKGSTARRANLLLGRTGQPFWQDESYDHYLRSSSPRAGPSPTSRTTLSPQAWSTAQRVGLGLARDGRRHRLPHQHYPQRLPQNVQTPEPAESRLQAELPAPPTLP